MNHKMDNTERAARLDARRDIVAAANKFRGGKTSFFSRHINQAVRICRYNGLVDSQVLMAAGFNG
jgi:hypothetical protein